MNAPKFTPWTIEGERLINSKLVVITQRESDGRDYPIVFASRDAAPLARSAPELYEEMLRHLPILERAEADPELWARITEGTGIATLNGYRAALAKVVSP